MDVSGFSLEDPPVGFKIVEVGEISANVDRSMLSESGQDKVSVTVQGMPCAPPLWNINKCTFILFLL